MSKNKTTDPIDVYKVVQTGGKTQFGGHQDGFSKDLYHDGISFLTILDPQMLPTCGKSVKPTAGPHCDTASIAEAGEREQASNGLSLTPMVTKLISS